MVQDQTARTSKMEYDKFELKSKIQGLEDYFVDIETQIAHDLKDNMNENKHQYSDVKNLIEDFFSDETGQF